MLVDFLVQFLVSHFPGPTVTPWLLDVFSHFIKMNVPITSTRI